MKIKIKKIAKILKGAMNQIVKLCGLYSNKKSELQINAFSINTQKYNSISEEKKIFLYLKIE